MKTLPLLIAFEYSEMLVTLMLYFVILIFHAISGSYPKLFRLVLFYNIYLCIGSLYYSVFQMPEFFLAATSKTSGLKEG